MTTTLRIGLLLPAALLAAALAGCSTVSLIGEPTATQTPTVEPTIAPTNTPEPSNTPTPLPTNTPVVKTITLDNVDDLKILRVINASDDQVTAVAFSPLDHTVATFGFDHTVRIFDADTGKLVRHLAGHSDWGLGLAYSPDGSTLGSAALGGDIQIWDPDKGSRIRSVAGSAHRFYSLEWSKDGKKFAVGGDGSSYVDIFSAAGVKQDTVKLPSGWVWSLAFSEQYLAVSNDVARSIFVYDAETYAQVQQLFHGGNPSGEIDFSPDGSLMIACQRDPNMYIWTTADWVLQATVMAHPKRNEEQGCVGGDFSAGGDIYFTGGDDGFVNAWDAKTGEALKSFDFKTIVWSVAVSGDGELVAAAVNGTVQILGLK